MTEFCREAIAREIERRLVRPPRGEEIGLSARELSFVDQCDREVRFVTVNL